jgi:hypothetical protein
VTTIPKRSIIGHRLVCPVRIEVEKYDDTFAGPCAADVTLRNGMHVCTAGHETANIADLLPSDRDDNAGMFLAGASR